YTHYYENNHKLDKYEINVFVHIKYIEIHHDDKTKHFFFDFTKHQKSCVEGNFNQFLYYHQNTQNKKMLKDKKRIFQIDYFKVIHENISFMEFIEFMFQNRIHKFYFSNLQSNDNLKIRNTFKYTFYLNTKIPFIFKYSLKLQKFKKLFLKFLLKIF
ncbi:hypothetical protein RFI_38398, partial [Reticulomyxa filosa]